MFYETASNKHGMAHDPFLACVVPRPIGWISTVDRNGTPNLAPYSFFNAVGHAPPKVMFSAVGEHGDGGPKDSLRNAEETGEFVCNMATWDLREQLNVTSAHFPRGVEEAKEAGLELVPSELVKAPRVKASPIHLECKYLTTLRLPTHNPRAVNSIVFGVVVGIHISEDVIVDGKVDVRKFRPIARMGYMDYAVVNEPFEMLRPTVGARPGFSTNLEMYGKFKSGT